MATSTHLAHWLHANVTAIAADEGFDVCFTEIAEMIRDIERVINRPIPPRFLGPCPEMVDAGHDDGCTMTHPHVCDTALRAHKRATSVTCEMCGAQHDVEGLFERQAELTGQYSYTLTELSGTIMPALREYVPLRTMQHWAASGKLNPTGYTAAAEPRFLLDDIRGLWAARDRSNPTGAAAHKRA